MTTVTKPAVKALAMAIAAALCAPLAYAVTPTAVWSGNLGQSYTIDGKRYAFTINPGTGTFNQDGTLTVTNAWTGYPSPYINISANGATSVSVLVKFSGLSLPVTSDSGVCIADMADSDDNEVGAYVAKGSSHLSAFYITDNAITQTDLNGSDNAVVESGYMLYSYSTTGGVKAYMGSSMDNLIGGKVESYKFGNGRTISRVSIGGDAQGKYYDPAGFTIEGVALFVNEFYSASDVVNYEFPAKIYSSDVNVSTINSDFPNASEIDVYLDDGVTVTGDTTFTATKVNFHCDGSFNMTGGDLTINAQGDGIDSNGNVNLIDGTASIKSSTQAGEAGIDYDGEMYISDDFNLNNQTGISGQDMMPGMNQSGMNQGAMNQGGPAFGRR